MRNRNNSETSKQSPEQVDTDSDRYLKPKTALRRLLDEGEFEDTQFELIEIRSTAGGELTWRVRAPRAEEMDVGYLGPA